jgi:S-adenosylmethionine:tRNA ribosyltransferase-isomerase
MPESVQFDLPPELIARYPTPRRDACRLMVVDRQQRAISHHRFRDLLDFLPPTDALVLNRTAVLPARLQAKKSTGARVEILLLSRKEHDSWVCLLKPSKRVAPGMELLVGDHRAVVTRPAGGGRWVLQTPGGEPFSALIERYGEVPLPPYLRREPIREDRRWYQTVFAKERGSVAAPTAGLHFTASLLEAIRRTGVHVCDLVVHLGAASFLPPEREPPGPEYYQISAKTASILNGIRASGGRVVAVGTSTARALETCAQLDRTLRPSRGMTEKIISPPYRFRGLDCLITNFHLPRSTHLLVVEALLGRGLLLDAYQTAIDMNYRFYSYGDAMLVL